MKLVVNTNDCVNVNNMYIPEYWYGTYQARYGHKKRSSRYAEMEEEGRRLKIKKGA